MTAIAPELDDDPTADLNEVHPSERAYGDVLAFLNKEAAYLDDDRHWDWLAMMAEDVDYRMPVRETLYRNIGRGIDPMNGHFNDNHRSLSLRVKRSMEVVSAYDREPPPRFRRAVSNVRVFEAGKAGEYAVTSYMICLRNRFSEMQTGILSGKREDLIRRTPDGLRLVRRRILMDQVVMDSNFINVFM